MKIGSGLILTNRRQIWSKIT